MDINEVISPNPPCIFVMSRFSQHKKDDDRWLSQPFYSAPGEYKLCFSVKANGGKGTHVSVYVRLMKGENDDHLQWPFEHAVTYRILNWKRDDNHVIKTIPFKKSPAMDKARVTSSERAPSGYGDFKVISHTLLYSSEDGHIQYLNEDCLCLQVVKVEPSKK